MKTLQEKIDATMKDYPIGELQTFQINKAIQELRESIYELNIQAKHGDGDLYDGYYNALNDVLALIGEKK